MRPVADDDRQVIDEFRHNGGEVAGPYAGTDLLLLHHVGARSGIGRVSPLVYWRVGKDSIAVLASNFGGERNPGWYYNLLAHPKASVELGKTTWNVRARPASAVERRVLLPRIVRTGSVSAEVERTEREMPIVILRLLAPVRRNAVDDQPA